MKSWRDVLDIPEPPADLVARLHDEASPRITRAITEHAARAGSLAPDDERALGRHVIQGVLADWRAAAYRDGTTGLSPDDETVLARAVHDQIYALGALQPCIDHPDVSDVHVSGHERTFVLLRDGTKLTGPPAAASDTELIAMLTRTARRAGRSERRFDREEVSLDLQLPGGARLHALREVTGRPVIDIRCHKWEIVSLDQLLKDHELDRVICDFLAAAVRARRNVVVSGGVAAGKTTMLRCLLNEVPAEERIITIEDSLELGIDRFPELHPDVETIEARDPNSEGKGAYTPAQGVRDSLRMGSGQDGRVVVGEVRGYEVIPMLNVMSQGKDGSMCTVHGNSARNALSRLQQYALEAPEHLGYDVSAIKIAEAVHFVVHLDWDRTPRPRRRVQSILEIAGAQDRQIMVNEIWKPDSIGRAVPGARLRPHSESQLVANGFDLRLLGKPDGWWQQ
jgi:Flp pilus assembly CpaF family ATPase